MIKQKNNFKGQYFTILLILIGIVVFNIINAINNLRFTNLTQQSLVSKFSEIHFKSPGNDFGGGIFWLGTNSVSQSIKAGGVTKKCIKQLKGIYYNAARGSRLWPLDQETLNLLSGSGIGYGNLSMTGGLYTACDGNTTGDKYSIYGYIKYDRAGTLSHIVAGAQLNYSSNSYTSIFANNFQYFNNQIPLGYIWDSVGGIGFIGGIISGDQNLLDYLNTGSINDMFDLSGGNIIYSGGIVNQGTGTAQDTMWNILIQGNVILSKAIDVYEKKAFLGNLGKKTVLLNSADINSSSIINIAKKNAELLCKGKTYFVSPAITSLPSNSTESVLCYKNINLVIDLKNDVNNYKNKTIIMKNGNISFKNSMTGASPALDLFIDGGNLYIQNNPTNKESFNNQGYPATTNVTNSGILIKGNYIINGLLLGAVDSTNQFASTTINHKFHLLGKTVILNTPTIPTAGRITQINDLLGSGFTTRINLENLFNWQCLLNGVGSDGTNCVGDSSFNTTPFVVLNEKFQSKILK